MDVAVPRTSLAQAIGRGGQNMRLASQLTGWEHQRHDSRMPRPSSEQEAGPLVENFMKQLDVDEDVAFDPRAGRLLDARGNRLRAAVRAERRSRSSTRTPIEELRNRARMSCSRRPSRARRRIDAQLPADDLLKCSRAWTGSGASSSPVAASHPMDDLADQAVDDLMEIDGMDAEARGKAHPDRTRAVVRVDGMSGRPLARVRYRVVAGE
jgi:N utilization substance protein A